MLNTLARLNVNLIRPALLRIVIGALLTWGISPTTTVAQTAPARPDRNTLLFISDVLSKTEYGNANESRTVRWETSPQMSVFGDLNRHSVLVKRCVADINSVLPKNRQIVQLEDDDETATLKLFFISSLDFDDVAKRNGFEVVKGNRGFFHVIWNEKYEIVKAYVLIAENRLSGRRLTHFVLEELTQTMGLVGDSPRIETSLFYESPAQGRYGEASRLTPTDKRLIKFLYTHVPPGSFPIEVGTLVERHW